MTKKQPERTSTAAVRLILDLAVAGRRPDSGIRAARSWATGGEEGQIRRLRRVRQIDQEIVNDPGGAEEVTSAPLNDTSK